jgi:hypothetical protein
LPTGLRAGFEAEVLLLRAAVVFVAVLDFAAGFLAGLFLAAGFLAAGAIFV